VYVPSDIQLSWAGPKKKKGKLWKGILPNQLWWFLPVLLLFVGSS